MTVGKVYKKKLQYVLIISILMAHAYPVTVSESVLLLKAATVHFGGCLETNYLLHIHLFIY